MSRADCIIVGAGALGLSAAFRLMRRGLRVRVVTAGRPDASLAAAGMLAPGIEAAEAAVTGAAHPRLGALLQTAAGRWPAFAAELCGHPADWRAIGYRKIDTLLAGGEADSNHLAALAKVAAEAGAQVETLSGNAARTLEPILAQSAIKALHFSGDALVEPPLLIGALREALKQGGVEIQIARIAAIAQAGDAVGLQSTLGDTLEAGAVILAAGWTGAIKLAPEWAHILPIKGQIATVSARPELRTMLRAPGIYLAPRGDGRVECGATSERGVDTLNVEPAAIRDLRGRAADLAPGLAESWTIASRSGVRPSTPDFAPILGASVLGDRVFLAAAPHRNGILLAPLIADITADAVMGALDGAGWLRALSATRFQG